MFDWFYTLFGTIMGFFNSITGSYALALLLFALSVKILMLPFAIKQQKTQIKGVRLRPKILLIEQKYAGRNDQVTLRKKQEEIMQLQQSEGYSPLAGCLPLLIQFPILIGLYNVIRSPLSYICKLSDTVVQKLNEVVLGGAADVKISKIDQIGIIGKLHQNFDEYAHVFTENNVDFTAADLPNISLFGLNLAERPSITNPSWLLVIPILSFVFAFLSVRLTRIFSGAAQMQTTTSEQQMSMKIMDFTMPAMSLFISFMVSGALGVYWIYQSIITSIQVVILAKCMPLPKYTDEELAMMAKAIKKGTAENPARQGYGFTSVKNGERPRSLHHIDDDDEDIPRVAPTQRSESKRTEEKKGLTQGVSLKKDQRNKKPRPSEDEESTSASEIAPECTEEDPEKYKADEE